MNLKKLIKLIYSGTLSTGQVSDAMALHSAQQISKALGATDFDAPMYNSPDNLLKANLQNNIYAFSSAKSYSAVKEMTEALIDKNGIVLSFADYKQKANEIAGKFNENYLEAEYNTAIGSAQMGAQWNRYQESKDVLPNLRFVTAGDDRVRDEHDKLDGIVRPIDDPFWDSHYPPLGWRCRCDVVQTAATPTTAPSGTLNEVDEYFRNNTGKDGIVFSENHPYFQTAGNLQELDAVANYGMRNQAKIYADPSKLPAISPLSASEGKAAFFRQLQSTNGIDNLGTMQLTDRFGNKLALTEATFEQAQNAHLVSKVLQNSSEVWQHADATYHLKYYQNKIIAARVNKQLELDQWLELSELDDISQMRKGVLMHR